MLKIIIPLTCIILINIKTQVNILFFITFIRLNLLKSWFEINNTISVRVRIDSLRGPLLILSLWVRALILIARVYSANNKKKDILNFTIIILSLILIIRFITPNIIIYYIIFEASLIPTLVIILGWGYQPERLQASIYLIIYTISASLPFLISLIIHLNKRNSLQFFSLFNTNLYYSYFSILFILAFIVKLPIYITHLWLPKAHVEAPVAGSIILAGILLKLGGYGAIRIIYIIKNLILYIQSGFVRLSIWGALATAMICIRQQDIKSLIAYSSVGHIALLIAGIISSTKWGMEGALTIIIAHGLARPALFALANISYEMNKTRRLILAKGILFLYPLLSVWWFLISIANIAAPPTLNLIGEIMLIISIVYNNIPIALLFGLSRFLAAVYSLILFTSTNHGKPNFFSAITIGSIPRNSIIIIFHFTPLYLIILFPYIFSVLY